ncbi:DUF3800 domain-containing protein [Mucilaginibacter roseus]|uniref:DUF3800 domain-containing protein n=1 Tax=Mucilaginibacter roseus TaxID=1528868 RepID=A0ABS8U6V5_9SPHI|nr:DUF3800 domain-containing protein [Mucilaginibacter roseus]MCD8741278.1 DUF3800 domain-containing protein [Mucilaginibacter roseus]
MYLMYVDESGDPGVSQHSSPHYILSGLIISQTDWDKYLQRLKVFRKAIKATYNLNQRTEIHTSELIRINKIEEYKRINKTDRINIIKDYCTQIPLMFDESRCINICIKKAEHVGQDIFNLAWARLLQRYDTFLKKDTTDKGIIIADDTNSLKLMNIQRKMRVFNIIPSHFTGTYNAPIDSILEDTFSRASHHSYFLQSVDVIAYCLYKKEYPKGSQKKYGLHLQFDKIEPILLKKASRSDNLGIVRS